MAPRSVRSRVSMRLAPAGAEEEEEEVLPLWMLERDLHHDSERDLYPDSERDLYPDSKLKVERVLDPDSETSSLCCACRQPIFSTPSISFYLFSDKLFMHEQCFSLPPKYVHELHPHQPLVLIDQLAQDPQPDATSYTCHNCNETCGTSFYHCPNPSCDFRLDLLCVLHLKIKHKSHNHALTVIRQRELSSLTCGACNTKHGQKPERLTISYLCNLCGYWIHPDCALLLNALNYEYHQHYLFLIYNFPTSSFSKCFFCSKSHMGSFGAFVCLKCTDYLVHISCARWNPQLFKPVLMRDAKASDLARLPMKDERTSLIPYIRHDITASESSSYGLSETHKHLLTLHENDDGNQSWRRVCNSCTQYVSPPFYRCSDCPDFYLHGCCARLPTRIVHRAHGGHRLKLYHKAPNSDSISAGFSCIGCHLWCNGFAYSCESCDFTLDVVCALITPAITHKPHKSNHFLFMSPTITFLTDKKCSCCSSTLTGICYSCSSCTDFNLHVRCALLPRTVRHAFDPHPLLLTTTGPREAKGGCSSQDEFFCEVCEENLEGEGPPRWHYSCGECDQWFHYDCIPSVDRLSRIKVGKDARVDVHGCPVALVRLEDGVCAGRRCGACGEKLKLGDDGLAYECSNCFFGLHQNCAKKHLLKIHDDEQE
ncbi:hypothetical protein SASPL_146297 [Salvia splendens]|uniref:DC1 domain-containing protein n=1 Tax=Salvia splendens TaxID=180675 RepID=A0A8X8WCZ6_SALSN|nr:uncharacterized protein LOC121776126 [Salvia splendens]KAG6392088.1 hypothetical protein SASPL_146297 [Salvia splendens]